MREIGKVLSIEGQKVVVEVERGAACQSCGRCGGHISFGDKHMMVEAVYIGHVELGDYVELEIPDRDYLRLSFLLYVFPLLNAGVGYGLGFLLGKSLGQGQIFAWAFALGGMALSFLWLRHYDVQTQKEGRYLPMARPLKDLN